MTTARMATMTTARMATMTTARMATMTDLVDSQTTEERRACLH